MKKVFVSLAAVFTAAIIVTVACALISDSIPPLVVYPDGARVQILQLLNNQCETVRGCTPAERYSGIYIRFEQPGHLGWYEAYIYNDGRKHYVHMHPDGVWGDVSDDGVNWQAYNFGQ